MGHLWRALAQKPTHLPYMGLSDSSLPPASDMGRQLFSESGEVFASPVHSPLLKGTGQRRHFPGISSGWALIMVSSVWFLSLQSSKGAVNGLIVNPTASQSVHTCSGSFGLIVNCTVCTLRSVWSLDFLKIICHGPGRVAQVVRVLSG